MLVRSRRIKTASFAQGDPADLERVLKSQRPYRHALVAVDGIYSMTGTQPPLFRRMVHELAQILFVEASTDLRLEPITVTTRRERLLTCLASICHRQKSARSCAGFRTNPASTRQSGNFPWF